MKKLVKVISLKYGFLESRKQVSQINLEASQISLEVGCGVGRGWGVWVWGLVGCGVEGVGHDYRGCYDSVFYISIQDPRFRDPRIRD